MSDAETHTGPIHTHTHTHRHPLTSIHTRTHTHTHTYAHARRFPCCTCRLWATRATAWQQRTTSWTCMMWAARSWPLCTTCPASSSSEWVGVRVRRRSRVGAPHFFALRWPLCPSRAASLRPPARPAQQGVRSCINAWPGWCLSQHSPPALLGWMAWGRTCKQSNKAGVFILAMLSF